MLTDIKKLNKLFFKRRITENNCWEWTGYIHPNGSGYTTYKNKHQEVYRIIMDAQKGQQVNHICNNRKCFNPDHLYFGTQKENVKDSIIAGTHVFNPGKNNREKTTCPKGHQYDKNHSNGRYIARRCSICLKEQKKIYKDKKRQERILNGTYGRKLKMVCKNGHENSYKIYSGKRRCSICYKTYFKKEGAK